MAITGIRERWRQWQKAKRAAEACRVVTHPVCRAVVGRQDCCCGDRSCSGGGWDALCWERVSLARWLLIGTCKVHTR